MAHQYGVDRGLHTEARAKAHETTTRTATSPMSADPKGFALA
jgi:hypothetical protein